MKKAEDSYTVLNGALQLINKTHIPRPSEDPIWLFEYFKKQATVQQGETLLDLGCGNGIITLLLAQAFPNCHIYGVDIQENLIQQAKENAQLNGLKNCTFTCANVLNISTDKKYNHVLSNPPYHRLEKGFKTTSEHKKIAHGMTVKDMKTWVEKAFNLTKAGGTFTFIQHTHNLKELEPLFTPFTHKVKLIQTNPQKPAKKFMAHIEK